jgi:hypothetical protein
MQILPPAQRRLWPSLRVVTERGFVLYGGTAVALRLGHRSSMDFDFFTDKPLARDELFDALPFLHQATVLQEAPDSLTLLTPGSAPEPSAVKLSFFGAIHFGRMGQPQFTEDGVVCVASLDDLMATKLKVILQRAESKDYQDITAMLRAGADLPGGLAAARALFGPGFQPSESLKALTYFEDGDLRMLSPDTKDVLIAAASHVRELPTVEIRSKTLGIRI